MKLIPGGVVRRVLAVSAVVALAAVSGCGSSEDGEAGDSSSDSAPTSESASPTPTDAASTPAAGKPGAAADGECGGGEFPTKVVKAARGVQVTVPADWTVKSAKAGAAVGLYPKDPDAGDGYVVVEAKQQTLDEAVDEVLGSTADSAEQTSERDLELEGFDDARMVTFAYDDSEKTYAVDVVAIAGGQRVAVDMTRDGDPEEQSVVESCLSTLSRK